MVLTSVEQIHKRLYGCNVAAGLLFFAGIVLLVIGLSAGALVRTTTDPTPTTSYTNDVGFFYACTSDQNDDSTCSIINHQCEVGSSAAAVYLSEGWILPAADSDGNVVIFDNCPLFNAVRATSLVFVILIIVSWGFQLSHFWGLASVRSWGFIIVSSIANLLGLVSHVILGTWKGQEGFFNNSAPSGADVSWGWSMIVFTIGFTIASTVASIFGVVSHRLYKNEIQLAKAEGSQDPLIPKSELPSTSTL